MKNIKEYLINCLLEENIITDAEVDYWYYRLEMYEGKMIHLLIIVFNCLLSKDKVAFLVYVIAFSLLRTHTGGYHSNSKLRCIFLSTLWYALVNFIVIPHVAGGSQSNYSSGVVANDASFDSGWEWSEDYSSIHKLYTSRSSSAYSTAYLSAD